MTASKSNRARAHGKDRTFRDLLLAATAVTAGFGVSLPAMAQESRPAASESDELVVTGSRAARSGFAAPTPTAVINSELVDRQAATGIGAVLVQNPAFKGTRNPGANATNTSSPAQWTADLRGLGGQRTLVLVNGSRIVPFAPASNLNVPTTTDLNLIPTLMIDRVEVVTGGASAQYGSDAVAGVVNILLKRQMDGFEVRAQAGISQESDNETLRIGFVGGRSFLSDRAHLVISGDYDRNDGVRDIYTRDWGSNQWMIVNNTGWATNGMPALLMSTNVNNALGAGGVIVGPAGFS
ncbi:MAG: TonB-dependent receptor plug domain-containing protein [Terricaulis sp.]|nr:TonB-dependent receptor plug domain-containing protein [Terricaulis sp.]